MIARVDLVNVEFYPFSKISAVDGTGKYNSCVNVGTKWQTHLHKFKNISFSHVNIVRYIMIANILENELLLNSPNAT